MCEGLRIRGINKAVALKVAEVQLQSLFAVFKLLDLSGRLGSALLSELVELDLS